MLSAAHVWALGEPADEVVDIIESKQPAPVKSDPAEKAARIAAARRAAALKKAEEKAVAEKKEKERLAAQKATEEQKKAVAAASTSSRPSEKHEPDGGAAGISRVKTAASVNSNQPTPANT
jgi:hypothetical protein